MRAALPSALKTEPSIWRHQAMAVKSSIIFKMIPYRECGNWGGFFYMNECPTGISVTITFRKSLNSCKIINFFKIYAYWQRCITDIIKYISTLWLKSVPFLICNFFQFCSVSIFRLRHGNTRFHTCKSFQLLSQIFNRKKNLNR